jgi:hypothetical protein
MFIKPTNCVICGAKYHSGFYDRGDQGKAKSGGTRYLCSKACRDILMQKSFDAIRLDNEQKIAQRKRTLAHYYANKPKWREYQNKRYLKNVSVMGV